MNLSYPELWLLELGCTSDASWLPVVWLVDTKRGRESGYNERWNCPANGLTGDSMARLLVDMQSRGLIEIGQRVDLEPAGLVVPKDSVELQAWMIDEHLRLRGMVPRFSVGTFHYVRVTTAGLACWEEYARPDWFRYSGELERQLEEPDGTVWSLSAMTEAFAREVLDVCGSNVSFPATIHWETARTTIHEPWEPFPGKSLPQGVTISVHVTEFGPRSIRCNEVQQFLQLSEKWRERLRDICHWYERGVRNHPDRPRPTTVS